MFKLYGLAEKKKPTPIMVFEHHRTALKFIDKNGGQSLSRCCPIEYRRHYHQCEQHNVRPTRIFRIGQLVFALGHERHRRERQETDC